MSRSSRRSRNFNPRSSCEERPGLSRSCCIRSHFNPRSSCEERPVLYFVGVCFNQISIHAPHARSDGHAAHKGNRPALISIHAPHARSDGCFTRTACQIIDFNPRSSCEERRRARDESWRPGEFQSTLLMRGATDASHARLARSSISIHAPHARSDHSRQCSSPHCPNFNPRSSCEERPSGGSSHDSARRDFNPRSSCEERLKSSVDSSQFLRFQSTLLMRGATSVVCMRSSMRC